MTAGVWEAFQLTSIPLENSVRRIATRLNEGNEIKDLFLRKSDEQASRHL